MIGIDDRKKLNKIPAEFPHSGFEPTEHPIGLRSSFLKESRKLLVQIRTASKESVFSFIKKFY
jgi:hypothetical protein